MTKFMFLGLLLSALFLAPFALAEEHTHCWHTASEQHAVYSATGHLDEVCCRCGKTVCRTNLRADPCAGHGSHAPGCALLSGLNLTVTTSTLVVVTSTVIR